MDIGQFNFWWISKRVHPDLLGKKRLILDELLRFLNRRQIILLTGMRRVGKTTLMYLMIDYLLSKAEIAPYHILYFSFDQKIENLDEILKEYSNKIVGQTFYELDHTCYIFLDEIQKLDNWANQLKLYYDLYPKLKFIISGSASINITKSAKESLAGRVFDFHITPLNFREYLEFKEILIDYDRIEIYKPTIEQEIQKYLLTSGFIEMIHEDNPEIFKRYFRESILERVIYQDLPESFSIREPSLLFKILKIVAAHPGLLIEYSALASELNRDQRTVAQYCDYLKYVFLIKSLYLFSRNTITSEKKLKKYYLTYPAFLYALVESPQIQLKEGMIIENLFASFLNAKFFYRSTTKEEVDFIQTEPETLPIEIKYKSKILPSDLRGMKSFMNRYKNEKGIVISKSEKSEIKNTLGRIEIVPYWEYLLQLT